MINYILNRATTIKDVNDYMNDRSLIYSHHVRSDQTYSMYANFIIEFYSVLDKRLVMMNMHDVLIQKLTPIYHKLDWKIISKSIRLSEETIIMCSDYLDWDNIYSFSFDTISENFIVNNINKISKFNIDRIFSEETLDKYFDKLYNPSSLNITFSENFINKYADKIGYNKILLTQNVSYDFIDKHVFKFNKTLLSTHPLNEEMVLKYIDYLNLDDVICNSDRILSQRFISYLKRYIKDNTIGPFKKQY